MDSGFHDRGRFLDRHMDADKRIEKIKNKAWKLIEKHYYNEALQAIAALSTAYYEINKKYCDDDLEQMICEMSVFSKKADYEGEEKNVLFYDGFGLDLRGLAYIYLRALSVNGYHVIYLTDEVKKEGQSAIEELLRGYDGEMSFIPDNLNYEERAKFILSQAYNLFVSKAFLYTAPDDASGILAFTNMSGGITRYQIDLTDHAFWLGKNAFDYCIEFRNYGASIAEFYRGIEKEKLLIQPYYPASGSKREFMGYPFNKSGNDFVVFSGGAIYKTLDAAHTYYDIVRSILDNYKNVKFWYAGFGECNEMDELLKDYPGRAFYTAERTDLIEVMKHCDVYLSTFPIMGGLMSQYAAFACRYPLTIRVGNHQDGVLRDNANIKLMLDSPEELLEEFEKIYTNEAYRKKLGDEVKKCIIVEEEFNENLKEIMSERHSRYILVTEKIDTSDFTKLYDVGTSKEEKLMRAFASRRYPALLKLNPFYYGLGIAKKFIGGIMVKAHMI